MTSHYPTLLEVTRKWRQFIGSDQQRAIKGLKLAFWVRLSSYRAVTRRRWQSVTVYDVMRPHVTGGHPQVTSFHRKSPQSDSRLPKTRVLGTLTSYRAVSRSWCQSRDEKWHHMTSRDRNSRHLTGSHLEDAVDGRKLVSLVRLTSYTLLLAGSSSDVTGNHVTWPNLMATRNWRHLTGSHLEVAVEGWKLTFWGRFRSYRAVTRRRWQSRDRKRRHVPSCDRKRSGSDVWPEVT